MSTSSYDESSTLVSSPTNGEKEALDKKQSSSGSSSATSTPKKSRGAFAFLTKSKEEKSKKGKAPKPPRPSKLPSKSVSKSPSKDKLADEFVPYEDRINEKSEEWQAFQQMQERIKQTVLKTQNSLSKLTSGKEKSESVPASSWIDFDAQQSESQPLSHHVSDDVTWASYQDNINTDVIEKTKHLAHLNVTPVPSPQLSPKPPVNSLRSSLEDLRAEETKPPQDVDFLGLFDNDEPSAMNPPAQNISLNQDLLGLDDFLSSSSSPSVSCTMQGTPNTDWHLSSTVPDPTHSDSPIAFTDSSIIGVEMKAGTSDLSSSLLYDFLQPDMKPQSDTSMADDILGDFLEPTLVAPTKKIKHEPEENDPFVVLPSKFETESKDPGPNADLFGEYFTENTQVQISATAGNPFNLDDTHSAPSPQRNPFSDDVSKPINPFAADPDKTALQSNLFAVISHETSSAVPDPFGADPTPAQPNVDDPFSALADFAPTQQNLDDPFSGGILEPSGNNTDLLAGSMQPLAALIAPVSGEILQASQVVPDGTVMKPRLIPHSDPFDMEITQLTQPDPFADLTSTHADEGFSHQLFTDEVDDANVPKGICTEKTFVTDSEGITNESFTFADTKVQDSKPALNCQDFDSMFESKGDTIIETVDTWGSTFEDQAPASSSANPFQGDIFSDDQVPITEGANPNLFLDDAFTDDAPANPFLENTVPLIAGPPQSGASEFDIFLDKDSESKAPTSDDFDPFGMQSTEASKVAAAGDVDLFSFAASAGDEQLVQPGDSDTDDEDSFMLEIRPTGTIDSGPAPALHPPPDTFSGSQRENPFNRESPPEENFAKFDASDDEEDSQENELGKLDRVKSMSTESSTSEEEDTLEELEPFHPTYEDDGWIVMLRQPTKKKITGKRYWRTVYVRLEVKKDNPVIKLYNNANEADSFQELPLQSCYSMSEVVLQQYDQYGKIHTVKLQYIFYRERVGFKPERITPSLVRKPKTTMILDHSPQVSELLKFGSLDKNSLKVFVEQVDTALMKLDVHRDKTLTYTKDEVQAEVWDEYKVTINKVGHIEDHIARVRVLCLAFITGMPMCELGLNDKRRKGKEVVGRHDIIPVKTEEWIKIEDVEFHCCVDKNEYARTNNIKFHPLDACQFELVRFRVRPKCNKELPLQLKIQQILAGSHVEIRCDLLVTGYHAYSKKHGQYPCEDIEIRFPIPDQWIYLFRYEKRFGYGSFKSAMRKPGKIKGLERITMMAQGAMPAMMEGSVGVAKYENVYKSVVWRISRLPERNQGAYTNNLFTLRLDLGPHDEIPSSFAPYAHAEFTMAATTVSKAQIRSISVENPDPPDKWVRLGARYEYKVEIEHIQEAESMGNNSD